MQGQRVEERRRKMGGIGMHDMKDTRMSKKKENKKKKLNMQI